MKNRCLHVVVMLVAFSSLGRAQIGTGWIQATYPETLDAEVSDVHKFIKTVPQHYASPGQSCSYTNADGIEEFYITSTNANRIEIRVRNDYQAPAQGRQFEGDVLMMPPTGNESLIQIFGNYTHATLFMLRGSDAFGGSLRYYTKEVLMTNVYGAWVHVNVIHMPGEYVQVYLNGEFKGQWPDQSMDHVHFFKYGCYGTLDADNAAVKWKDVKFFTGGEPPDRAQKAESVKRESVKGGGQTADAGRQTSDQASDVE